MTIGVRPLRHRAVLAAFVIVSASAALPAAAQVQYETIHDFTQGPGAAVGRLVQAADGNLYGAARDGGAFGGGTVFVIRRVSGVWMPAVTLHDFSASEGTAPIGGLIEEVPGIILGTTTRDGAFGGGTIFRLSIFGAFQVIASFNPAVHGARPIAELTLGLDRNYYGTTLVGGPGGYGTVFRLNASGSLTLMHAFVGTDGAFPAGAIALGSDGQFYGTTYQGGVHNSGTAFRMTHAGAFRSLHSFERLFVISRPLGRLTLAPDGALYGVASFVDCVGPACGIGALPIGGLFRIAPDGSVSTFRNFREGTPGPGVVAGSDGWLYGTFHGGAGLYRVQPGTAVFEILVNEHFSYPTGLGGYGALLLADDGRFYKGTESDGIGGHGTVFSVSVAGDVRVLHNFRSDGFHPVSSLLYAGGGVLLGSTHSGGRDGVGTVFKLHPGRVIETQADFPGGNGRLIYDLLPYVNDVLVPTSGRIMAFNDRTFTMLAQFGPSGPPVAANGTVYAISLGRVLRIDTEEVLHQFPFGIGVTGAQGLIAHNGVLYGVTRLGGAHNRGTVFSLRFDGTFATLHEFSGPDGQWPAANLVVASDGITLVGTTSAGGDTSTSTDGNGTVFKIARDGSGFATLHAFGPGEGRQPVGRLTYRSDGPLYGTTLTGGFGFGTVFMVSLDGSFTTLHAFAPGEAAHPFGGLSFNADGALYGTTPYGGRGKVGTIFAIRGVQ